MSVRLSFHGAAGGVTGSCYRLETGRSSVLVDCGLFQGPKTLKELNYRDFPFDARRIEAVLLTHAHVDHCGLLPKLILAGFDGPIPPTAGTREPCAVMLPDAGGIQEHEVEQLNRRFQRRGRRPIAPIYTAADAESCLRLFAKVRYGDWVQVTQDVRARWWDAGHILGSASIEVEAGGAEPVRLLFSGDVGAGATDYVSDPQGPSGVDHVILESTYGDRERATLSSAQRRAMLAAEVRAAEAAGGPLVAPAFAVERTQQLIADLVTLMEDEVVRPGPIFLDSPLAIQASEVFYEHGRNGEGINPFDAMRRAGWLHTTESADESRAIEKVTGWHVIIAASGMCDAGRIRHHLKRLLWRKEATVMLTGYQATGTLGRILQDGARRVSIQGELVRVQARVRMLDVYSGHADASGLVAWAKARAPVTGKVFLTHGEPQSRKGLKGRLVEAGFGAEGVETPELDGAFRLRRATSEVEHAAPRLPAGAATRLDWHNVKAQLLIALNEAIETAPDDATRAKLLERLLEELPTAGVGGDRRK
jgi:metallo-beta-lactamase family protein